MKIIYYAQFMRHLIIIFSLFIFSSCSFYGTIAKNIDFLIKNKLTEMLDLYAKQEDQLYQDVKKFLNTEKETFKSLKNLLLKTKTYINSNQISPEDIKILMKEFEIQYINLGESFLPIISKYLLLLDEPQREELYKNWDKENKKIKKKKKNKLKTYKKKFADFFGELNESQDKVLEKYKELFLKRNKIRLKSRLDLQKKLKVIFKKDKKDKTDKNIKKITALIVKSMQNRINPKDRKGYSLVLSKLLMDMDKEKKDKILKKLNQAIGIVDILSIYKY